MTDRDTIVQYLNETLNINDISDASVNGLQVQGNPQITRVALCTDAALETYQLAAKAGCQMIIAHHGLIWGSIKSVTNRNYNHLKCLMDNDLNLYACHLPLDAHPTLGNNGVLAARLKLQNLKPFGDYHGASLGFSGELPTALSAGQLKEFWAGEIGGTPTSLDFGPDLIKTVAIVSGGGSSCLGEAIAKNIDCLITGEGKHENFHQAQEGQITAMYIGHYYSETVGVKAVGKDLAEKFGVETTFIDVPTGF